MHFSSFETAKDPRIRSGTCGFVTLLYDSSPALGACPGSGVKPKRASERLGYFIRRMRIAHTVDSSVSTNFRHDRHVPAILTLEG